MARRLLFLASLVLLAGLGCDGQGGAVCGELEFTVSKNEVSAQIPTVGVVEWSLTGAAPSSAKLVFKLKGAPSSLLNQGGEAPVDLGKPNHRTLLLGLKQSSDYTFHLETTREGATCVSADYALPTTGSFPDARPVTVAVAADALWPPAPTVSALLDHPGTSNLS